MKAKNLLLLTLLGTTAGGLLASADFRGGPRWRRHDGEFSRRGFELPLGTVRLGDEMERIDAESIDVRNMRQIECNLSHIKLTALNKGVRIFKVIVEYRNGQRDSVDLNDSNDNMGPPPGFPPGRPGRPGGPGGWRDRHGRGGLRLMAGQASEWLDIDDVQDGVADGRCVDRITIMGNDIDFNRFGRPGFDQGSVVMVQGFVRHRQHGPGPGGFPGRPGGFPGRPGGFPGRPGGFPGPQPQPQPQPTQAVLDPRVFDVNFYRAAHGDLRAMNDAQLVQHWLTYGINEGRQASPTFSSAQYLANYEDLRRAFGNNYRAAIEHYIAHGIREGRSGVAVVQPQPQPQPQPGPGPGGRPGGGRPGGMNR